MGNDENWVLTSLELCLAVKLLGNEDWTDIAVQVKEARTVEEQMLESFIHLAEMGFVENAGEGYYCTDLLRSALGPVALGENATAAFQQDAKEKLIYLWDKNDAAVILEPIPWESDSYRVICTTKREFEKSLRTDKEGEASDYT